MNNNTSYTIRILAGGYIVYLGYSLITAFAKGETDMAIWMLLFPILFLIAGGGILFISIRGLMRNKKDEAQDKSNEQEREEEEDRDKV